MSSPVVPKDFPDWMGPMLIKELRQGMKARGFEFTFILLQVVLVLVLSYHAFLYGKFAEKFNPSGLHSIFWVIVALQLLVITPLRALTGLSSERKANTLELIFMTGLTSWRIAFGKWASLMFQTLLFILAVLPYAFLRYFFGGVNLTEDLITLGCMFLASGVLTALALAISGLPLFFRIASMILAGFAALSILPGMIFGLAMTGRMWGSFSMSGGMGWYWLLLIYNIVLIGSVLLAFAASTIGSLAENHAMRGRLLALGAFLPVPLMIALGGDKEAAMVQLSFFAIFAFVICWLQLAAFPSALRVHIEPFSKRGLPGFVAGLFLQPGWPSAVLFLVLVEGMLVGFAGLVAWLKSDQYAAFYATVLMGGAALLTPVFLLVSRSKLKLAFAWQTVILLLCGLLAFFAKTLGASSRMGENLWGAILPPFGFWAMLDDGLDAPFVSGWFAAGAAMFVAIALLLMTLSGSYWRRLIQFHREIRAARQKPLPVVDSIAA